MIVLVAVLVYMLVFEQVFVLVFVLWETKLVKWKYNKIFSLDFLWILNKTHKIFMAIFQIYIWFVVKTRKKPLNNINIFFILEI